MKFFKEHKTLSWSIYGAVLIIAAIVYVNVSTYQDKRNIFDEIYYVEKDVYPQTNTVLNGLEGISTRSYVDSKELFSDSAHEFYEKKYIPKDYSHVGLSFYLKNPETLVISFEKQLTDNVTIRVGNKYLVEKKSLQHYVMFSVNGKYIEDTKQIADLRKQYNITDQMLEQYNKEILNDFFLRDWCKAYDSKYTPNNWGEVKVEKGWE